ncbi:MAG: hypothetical protein ACR2MX_06545 [Cyclobacteriaceae bacterium]
MENQSHRKLARQKDIWVLIISTLIIWLIAAVSYTAQAQGHKSTTRIISKNGVSKYEIKIDGIIKLTDDDSDLKSISPGGYFQVSKTTFGNKRKIIIERDGQGGISRKYYIGRKLYPFEPEGKEWLAEVLVDVVRSTGIDAENRVDRIYSKGGVKGVLDEIDEITSNSVKGTYFRHLLNKPGLTDSNLIQIVDEIGSDISSNTTRGELLRKYEGLYFKKDETATALLRNLAKLSSSTTRGSVLRSIMDRHDQLSDKTIIAILGVTGKISSNTEVGSVLRRVNKNYKLNGQTADAYFEVIDHLSSNTEAGRVLRDILSTQKLNTSSMVRVLESTGRLSSNTEMGSILRKFNRVYPPGNGDIAEAYFSTINRISSNTERGTTLRDLISSQDLGSQDLVKLLNSAGRISSSSELGSVLRRAIPELTGDPAVSNSFFDTVGKLSSSTEMGSVLRSAVAERGDKNTIIKVLKASEKLTSNTEAGSVIYKVASVMPKSDPQVIEAYKSAASKLTSDSEYRRVMSAID